MKDGEGEIVRELGEKDVTQAWVKRREMRDEGTGEKVGKREKRV